MSAANACRSYVVTASMAAVEALKDQGFARWNYPLRNLHHRLKNNLRSSLSQSSRASSSAAGVNAAEVAKRRANKTEKYIKKVMELDCWGPTTIRF